ncbi:D-methionine transport system permease protein [Actinopolyspora mzabensis]|uniref:D-methionine transport system permease protein n=1 Tax=Actinopolyspora mzabensis TaxID=995066 RepID=A0A1G8VM51_ACTMZ|nr:methionine ABC transporter permease [Actinopolyspora mzabensis]SDJ67049.1 D-methionine transport system permease protein [Actinopolyspora mzabensis]
MSDVTPWSEVLELVRPATVETLYMVLMSTLVGVVGGLPLGVWLHMTSHVGLTPKPLVHRVLGAVVDVTRSIPFVVLLVVVGSLTRLLMGQAFGSSAAIVPLAIAAVPFFARLTSNALREVDSAIVEAAVTTGAGKFRIVWTVLLSEARAALVGAVGVTMLALIGYAAMAGAIAGGGLGATAILDGYNAYDDRVLYVSVVLLGILAWGMQLLTDWVTKLVDRRRAATNV